MPNLSDRELATVLAALRHWRAAEEVSTELWNIATNKDAFEMLKDAEIDDLCVHLNAEQSTFGRCVHCGAKQGSPEANVAHACNFKK